MNSDPQTQFTFDRRLEKNAAVFFRCCEDAEKWPWLRLHPQHPILLQNLQYWASVEAGIERGTFDGKKWTALTWTRWQCGADNVGPIVRGLSEIVEEDGRQQSQLTFFDASDAVVCTMRSMGVEFRNRDFETWRAKAKASALPPVDLDNFAFAPRVNVGCDGIGPALISPLREGANQHSQIQTAQNAAGEAGAGAGAGAHSNANEGGGERAGSSQGDRQGDREGAQALMTMQNAFPPGHPYMSGSGDHVNATHLAEAARQFVHLAQGSPRLRIIGGEMRFTHYVELDRVFEIDLVARGNAEDGQAQEMTMQMSQGGKDCTRVTLQYVLK